MTLCDYIRRLPGKVKTAAIVALGGLALLAAVKVVEPGRAEAAPLDSTLIYAAPNLSISTATSGNPYFGVSGGLKLNNQTGHGIGLDGAIYGFNQDQIGKLGVSWRPLIAGNRYNQFRVPTRFGLIMSRGGEKQVDFAPSVGLEGLFTIGNFVLCAEAGIDGMFKGGGFKETPDIGGYVSVGGCL